MHDYAGVCVRYLRQDERLMQSHDSDMPLVIEATTDKSPAFIQRLLHENAIHIQEDLSRYGSILLRGFEVHQEETFEKSILSLPFLRGISDAFMSEEGRDHFGHLQFVLHTNAIYKTGGTAYLGGFHSENYYSADVPSYIHFFCMQPSQYGGETGLINMRRVYQKLPVSLQKKLEEKPFLAAKWVLNDVAKRYQISPEALEDICRQSDLPVIGKGRNKLILMYKPSVFLDPISQEKALQINFFQILALNKVLRRYFMADYAGKKWLIHRFVWRLPEFVLKLLEYSYMSTKAFMHSPRDALILLGTKLRLQIAWLKTSIDPSLKQSVNHCFNREEIDVLAKWMHHYYVSCLWKKGDILMVDNKQVVHAGMPGAGPRVVRALISNPLAMCYSEKQSGLLYCEEKQTNTIGHIAQNQH